MTPFPAVQSGCPNMAPCLLNEQPAPLAARSGAATNILSPRTGGAISLPDRPVPDRIGGKLRPPSTGRRHGRTTPALGAARPAFPGAAVSHLPRRQFCETGTGDYRGQGGGLLDVRLVPAILAGPGAAHGEGGLAARPLASGEVCAYSPASGISRRKVNPWQPKNGICSPSNGVQTPNAAGHPNAGAGRWTSISISAWKRCAWRSRPIDAAWAGDRPTADGIVMCRARRAHWPVCRAGSGTARPPQRSIRITSRDASFTRRFRSPPAHQSSLPTVQSHEHDR